MTLKNLAIVLVEDDLKLPFAARSRGQHWDVACSHIMNRTLGNVWGQLCPARPQGERSTLCGLLGFNRQASIDRLALLSKHLHAT